MSHGDIAAMLQQADVNRLVRLMDSDTGFGAAYDDLAARFGSEYARGVLSAACDEYDNKHREEEEEDPICVCGVYRSEHALCGCGEWQRRR